MLSKANLADLQTWLRAAGQEVQVLFDGAEGDDLDIRLQDGTAIPEEILEQLATLSRLILAEEIPGWDSGAGAAGRLRLDGSPEAWLDADDRNEDWTLARGIDLADIIKMHGAEALLLDELMGNLSKPSEGETAFFAERRKLGLGVGLDEDGSIVHAKPDRDDTDGEDMSPVEP